MASFISSYFHFPILSLTLLLLAISSKAYQSSIERKIPTFFIFGDSTVDPGNNNYIQTVPENQANYPPYGQNGFFEGPTGRFSNGRVIVDFIAEYATLPIIPPFLQPSVEFINGANFASGGAGVLPETNQGLAIDLQKQLKYFEDLQKLLAEQHGVGQAKELISEAIYFISVGSNDYLGGYFGNPKMRESYGPEEYVAMVIGNLTQVIQVLYEKGGRKFGFLGLSPLGCLPALRALNPNPKDGVCYEEASALALAHNNALSAVLTSLEHIFKGFKYSHSNFYNWLSDRMDNPSKYNFKDGVNACCGTGPFGGIYSCGGTKAATSEYQLCDTADEYIWWDSFHPTETIHQQFAQLFWNGPPISVGPYNLESLFFGDEKLTIADIVDDRYDGGSSIIV
ncbi:GDSL esterase/lipase 5-like [Tasmannia lanceolata]|uniref:GDSL esterase/lipase 5-like n=1 Tax=Tasmannia lanceolata TaxID=3420 RepID=UPI0040627FA1